MRVMRRLWPIIFDFLLVWQASAKIRLSDFLPPILGVTVKQTIIVFAAAVLTSTIVGGRRY
jgi:hypothetical protein